MIRFLTHQALALLFNHLVHFVCFFMWKKQDSLLCRITSSFPEELLFQCFKKCWGKNNPAVVNKEKMSVPEEKELLN